MALKNHFQNISNIIFWYDIQPPLILMAKFRTFLDNKSIFQHALFFNIWILSTIIISEKSAKFNEK